MAWAWVALLVIMIQFTLLLWRTASLAGEGLGLVVLDCDEEVEDGVDNPLDEDSAVHSLGIVGLPGSDSDHLKFKKL